MRCPHCGFRHLEWQQRCARCRKPLPDDCPDEMSMTGEMSVDSAPENSPKLHREVPPREEPTEGREKDLTEPMEYTVGDNSAGSFHSSIEVQPPSPKPEITAEEQSDEHSLSSASATGEDSSATDRLSLEDLSVADECSDDEAISAGLDEIKRILSAASPEEPENEEKSEGSDQVDDESVWTRDEAELSLDREPSPPPGPPESMLSPKEIMVDTNVDDALITSMMETRPGTRSAPEFDDSESGDADESDGPEPLDEESAETELEPSESGLSSPSRENIMEPDGECSGTGSDSGLAEGSDCEESRGSTDGSFDNFHEPDPPEGEGDESEDDELSQIRISPRAQEEIADEPKSAFPFLDESEPSQEPPAGIRAVRPVTARPRKPKSAGRVGALVRTAGTAVVDLTAWTLMGVLLFKGAKLVTGLEVLNGTAWEWITLVLAPLLIMVVILALVYGGMFGSVIGRTPGMMMFGLRITGEQGSKPSSIQAFLATAIFIASVLPLGAGLILGLRKGELAGFHGRLSKLKVERV